MCVPVLLLLCVLASQPSQEEGRGSAAAVAAVAASVATEDPVATAAHISSRNSGSSGSSGLAVERPAAALSQVAFNRLCGDIVSLDRNQYAVEKRGYSVRMCTMPGLSASAKTDMLMGWPQQPQGAEVFVEM